MKDWIYIDEAELNNAQQIHCDTRDFFVLTSNNPVDGNISNFINTIKEKPNVYNNCIFKDVGEVYEYLKELEEASGGKGEWRYLTFNYPKHSSKYMEGWHKYLRFAKVEDGYFAYINEGMINHVIRKDYVSTTNMVKGDTLNFIK